MGESKDTRRVSSSGGVELALHELCGSGATVLIAHATGFHGRAYLPLAQELCRRTALHCWAPDLRGHGDASALDDGDYQWSGFSADVLAVVDALGGGPLFGVGHSMGAAALVLAEEQRPGTFRRLYCYEPIIIPPQILPHMPAESPVAKSARRRRESFASKAEALKNYASKPPLNRLDPEALRLYVEHGLAERTPGSVHLKCRPGDEAQIFRMSGTAGAFDDLGSVACPVTVARGAVETSRPSVFVEAIARELPKSRVEAFDHLSHFGPLEEPATVAASIVRVFF